MSAKKRSAAKGGGISLAPPAHPVSSLLVPSGQVVFDNIAAERSKNPNAPARFAFVKSASSSDPPMKFTTMAFSRLAPVKSALLRFTSSRMDSLMFRFERSAPARFVLERSTRPKSRSFKSWPERLRPLQSPSMRRV